MYNRITKGALVALLVGAAVQIGTLSASADTAIITSNGDQVEVVSKHRSRHDKHVMLSSTYQGGVQSSSLEQRLITSDDRSQGFNPIDMDYLTEYVFNGAY